MIGLQLIICVPANIDNEVQLGKAERGTQLAGEFKRGVAFRGVKSGEAGQAARKQSIF